MTVRVLIGHVLERLAELPAESVHCVVTSPPYYGLRDYGIEPQVWGGTGEPLWCIPSPGCIRDTGHEWGDEATAYRSPFGADLVNPAGGSMGKKKREGETVSQGAFCRRCNAWRGSLGLEPTPALYIEHMVAVFREIRRVLRRDGTLWLNIGDSYAGSASGGFRPGAGRADGIVDERGQRNRNGNGSAGCKPKDLLGIPWALAFALRDDGWWLRSEITWAKRAPMPESVTDRPTTATEKVFLLTKSGSPTYWTHRDHEGTRTKPAPDYRWQRLRDSRQDRVTLGEVEYETAEEPPEWRNDRKHWRRINLWDAHDYFYDAEAVKEPYAREWDESNGGSWAHASRIDDPVRGKAGTHRGKGYPLPGTGANLRNFWLLGPEPFPEAHFAVYPTEIPKRAILAGTSERGVCSKCLAPYGRITKSEEIKLRPNSNSNRGHSPSASRALGGNPQRGAIASSVETIGWLPTCSCNASAAVPATCLDPFLGAGTTALVADRLNRHCIGIELNPQYAAMAKNRIRRDAPLFADIAAE